LFGFSKTCQHPLSHWTCTCKDGQSNSSILSHHKLWLDVQHGISTAKSALKFKQGSSVAWNLECVVFRFFF
jgi:hypothetical protein